MTIAALLSEFDLEMANTRKILESVPADKFAWTPHQKSSSLRKIPRRSSAQSMLFWRVFKTGRLLLVGRGTVHAGHRHVEPSQIDSELAAIAARPAARFVSKASNSSAWESVSGIFFAWPLMTAAAKLGMAAK